MASLMEAVANGALNLREWVAASCLARMAPTMARLVRVWPGWWLRVPSGLLLSTWKRRRCCPDGVGDGVGVQILVKNVLRGL